MLDLAEVRLGVFPGEPLIADPNEPEGSTCWLVIPLALTGSRSSSAPWPGSARASPELDLELNRERQQRPDGGGSQRELRLRAGFGLPRSSSAGPGGAAELSPTDDRAELAEAQYVIDRDDLANACGSLGSLNRRVSGHDEAERRHVQAKAAAAGPLVVTSTRL